MAKLSDDDLQFVCFAVRGKLARMAEMLERGTVSALAIRESLPLAARKGRAEACRLLLEHGADPYHVNFGHKSAVQFAFEEGRWETLLLLDPVVHADTADYRLSETDKRLHTAIRDGDAESVRAAIAADANVNSIAPVMGHTLNHAVRPGTLPLVSLLVEAGADVNHVDPHTGQTPLGHARHYGDRDLVEYLREQGASKENGAPVPPVDDRAKRVERYDSAIREQLDYALDVMVPAQRGT